MATLDVRHRDPGRRRRGRRHRDLAGHRAARASRPSSVSGSCSSGARPVEPGLAGPLLGGRDPAGRRDRGGRRRRSRFGIRTLPLDPERGLRINGETVSCAARASTTTTARSARRRSAAPRSAASQLLKAAGFNAIRSAHNPMSRAMLDACDRLRRAGHGRADRHVDRGQVRLRRRAATSPSGGSATSRRWSARTSTTPASSSTRSATRSPRSASPHGAVWSRRLAEKVRSLDATRFVTNGINAHARASSARRRPPAPAEAGINTMLTDMGAFMNELGGVRAGRRRGRRSPSPCSTWPA